MYVFNTQRCSLAPVDQSSDCSDDLDWVDEETENDNSLEVCYYLSPPLYLYC